MAGGVIVRLEVGLVVWLWYCGCGSVARYLEEMKLEINNIA